MTSNKNLNKGFKWVSIMQIGVTLIRFIATIVLARLLTPNDFGLIGSITVFIAFCEMLVDSGMGGSLLRKQNVDSVEYSTLFIYNFGISIFLYLFLFFLAPYIAQFYNKEILISLLRVLSITIILNAISRVHYIALLRSFRYKLFAVVAFASNLIALLVAVYMGYLGYGVWALVAQQLLVVLVSSIFYIGFNKFFPKIEFSLDAFKEQFAFGVYLLGANMLSTVSNNIHASVMSKFLGIGQTGYFVQADKVKNLPINFITTVIDKTVFPVFARTEDNEDFRNSFKDLSIKLYFWIFSLITLLVFISKDLVLLILGNKWLESGWMMSMLFLGAFPMVVQIMCRTGLKARSFTKQIFYNEIFKGAAVLSALLLTYNDGVYFIILGLIGAQFFATLFIMFVVDRRLQYGFLQQLRDVLPILFISLFSLLILNGLDFLFLLKANAFLHLVLATVFHILIVTSLAYLFKINQVIILLSVGLDKIRNKLKL